MLYSLFPEVLQIYRISKPKLQFALATSEPRAEDDRQFGLCENRFQDSNIAFSFSGRNQLKIEIPPQFGDEGVKIAANFIGALIVATGETKPEFSTPTYSREKFFIASLQERIRAIASRSVEEENPVWNFLCLATNSANWDEVLGKDIRLNAFKQERHIRALHIPAIWQDYNEMYTKQVELVRDLFLKRDFETMAKHITEANFHFHVMDNGDNLAAVMQAHPRETPRLTQAHVPPKKTRVRASTIFRQVRAEHAATMLHQANGTDLLN